jgi:hypothetical protein
MKPFRIFFKIAGNLPGLFFENAIMVADGSKQKAEFSMIIFKGAPDGTPNKSLLESPLFRENTPKYPRLQ